MFKQPAPSNVFLNSVSVQFSEHVKYLGVLLNPEASESAMQQASSEAILFSAQRQ